NHRKPLISHWPFLFCLVGIIAVVIFGMVFALVMLARFLYRRKGTCQNQEVEKPEDASELPFSNQTCSQNGLENQKEYFI
uniref:Neurexin/syndecan/glycophorin C domain-containing protein n=1 Tax=Kryptolebias marmoratus TaxID=37003 RepID=A0A3Q3AXE0_KRYMA